MRYYVNKQFGTLLYKVDSDNKLFGYSGKGLWYETSSPDSWELFYKHSRELSKAELVKRILKQ